MMLFKILLVMLLLVFLIYYMPVKMLVKTIRENDNDVMVIRLICLYGLLKLKYEIPYMDFILRRGKAGFLFKSELKQPDEKEVFKKSVGMVTTDQIKKMYEVYKVKGVHIKRALNYITSKLKICDLSIIYKIGTGDAASTAYAYGLAWIILGSVLSVLCSLMRVTTKDIIVKPDFEGKAFNIELGCIITLNLGHIINTGIKLFPVLYYILKNKISFRNNNTRNLSTAERKV